MGIFGRFWSALDRVVAALSDMAGLVEGANAEIRARAALPASGTQQALPAPEEEPASNGVARKRKGVVAE